MGVPPEILALMQAGGGAGGGGPMGGGMAGPGGGPQQLDALASMQQGPPPHGEEEALADATMKIGMALARIHLRSPKAAKMLTEALSKIQGARQEMQTLAQSPVSPPPSLGMAEAGMVPGVTH